jgi:DinB superfamily
MDAAAAPRAPNELTDPQGYQRYLLGLLGDDDPAETQAATPAALRALVAEAGDRLTARPEPGEWAVYGCLAHIADAELVMSARYRFVLAHDEPPLIGYDQDRWVDRLHGDDGDVGAMLDLFEALRTANVALWRSTTEADRDRVGMHGERGPESYDLAFRMIAGHDRFHIAQARRALGP